MDSAVGTLLFVICFKPAFYPPAPQKKRRTKYEHVSQRHIQADMNTQAHIYLIYLSINIIYIYIYINLIYHVLTGFEYSTAGLKHLTRDGIQGLSTAIVNGF